MPSAPAMLVARSPLHLTLLSPQGVADWMHWFGLNADGQVSDR